MADVIQCSFCDSVTEYGARGPNLVAICWDCATGAATAITDAEDRGDTLPVNFGIGPQGDGQS